MSKPPIYIVHADWPIYVPGGYVLRENRVGQSYELCRWKNEFCERYTFGLYNMMTGKRCRSSAFPSGLGQCDPGKYSFCPAEASE